MTVLLDDFLKMTLVTKHIDDSDNKALVFLLIVLVHIAKPCLVIQLWEGRRGL